MLKIHTLFPVPGSMACQLTGPPVGQQPGGTFSAQDISRFGDINLSAESSGQKKKEKFDKKDFANPNRSSGLEAKQDSSDPFSTIDPMWNLKQT